MRTEARGRRQGTRHHQAMHVSMHRADDTSSPFTSGALNLAPAQFGDQYVRNPIRRQYRTFMRNKTPYARYKVT